MYDLQRERMKHMVTTAILEMWKKETGSLSSVVIEGTICITSGNGRNTVLQLADKFDGSGPGARTDCDLNQNYMPAQQQTLVAGSPYQYAPHVDTQPNPSHMAAYFDELSPASLVSPGTDYSHSSGRNSQLASAVHSRQNSMDVTMEASLIHIKEESVESDESGCDVTGEDGRDKSGCPLAGPTIPGTGFSPTARSPSVGEPASPDGSLGELQIMEAGQPTTSTPKVADDSGNGDSMTATGALDLSKKDSDLALSPPQSYTAQVRDVIRQRLLAGRVAMTKTELPATVSSNYPLMLQSLGKPGPDRKPISVLSTFHPYKLAGIGASSASSPMGAASPLLSSPAMLNSSYPPSGLSGVGAKLGNKQLSNSLNGPLHTMLSMQRTQTPSPSPSNPDTNGKNGDQKVFKCDFCSKSFLFKSKYHEHLPVHTNVRPYQCDMCSRTYKYKYDLRVHSRTHSGIPTKSTVCPFCNDKFDSNKVLRDHIEKAHANRLLLLEASENIPPKQGKLKGAKAHKSPPIPSIPVFPGVFTPIEGAKLTESSSSSSMPSPSLPVFPGSTITSEAPVTVVSVSEPSGHPAQSMPVFPGNFPVEPEMEAPKTMESQPESDKTANDTIS